MASIFPGSPSLNDVFESNGTTWQWNGEAWVVVASDGQTFTNIITSPSSQTIIAESATDTLTFAAGTDITISGTASSDTLTISSSLDKQGLINTASAAAYSTASGYANYLINGLTTSDIEEGSNLYYTNERAVNATSFLITSASANALSQANTYTNSASSSLVGYINTASSSLVNYTDSASASLIAYTNSASSSLVDYTNTASASLVSYTNEEISKLDVFSYVATSPSTQLIQGDSNSDTLTFIAGENISINADSSTDSITINSTGNYTSVDSISYPDYIVFDTTPEVSSASTSTLAWDSGEGGLGLQLNANTQVTLGQEIIVLCNNGEATTLNKGEVVRLSGAQGQRPKVTRAYNTSDAGSALTFGIVAESIASGAEGFIVTQGIVKNINTNGFNEGDILYLSASAGVLTTVKPQAPNHYVFVGVVTKKNASSGRIYVKPQNGYELDELHNVRIVSASAGDIIIWNSASSLWLNEPLQNYLNSASVSAYNAASAYTTTHNLLVSGVHGVSGSVVGTSDTQTLTNKTISGSANTLTSIPNSALVNDSITINGYEIFLGSAAAYSTDNISEGTTNLYFTNQRAIDAASATYIPQSSQQSIINSASGAAVTYLVDSAPAALDTLNELAAALGDDANFATTVTNSLANKLDSSTASATYLTQANASITYIPQTSQQTIINTASAAAVAYADALTTTDIAEGTNLYFTEERVESTASAMFVHGQHTNLNASYSAASGIIILSASGGGGGGATVAYQTTQPDVAGLDTGSLWIDSDQDAISGLLPATFTRWIKVLSASATTISGLDDNALSLLYTAGYEKVFINGTLLARGSDYTATTGNTIVLTVAAESGDIVEIHAYEAFQLANTYTQTQIDSKFNNYTRWSETYTASAATITGTDDYANVLNYTAGYERVFVNGILLDPSEYTRTSASVITPDEAILSGDVVEVFNIESAQIGDTYTTAQIDAKYNNRTRWTKTYSASATVISGADDNSNTLSYTSGNEEVFLNGILLMPTTEYTRTSASSITLGAAVVSGDVVDVVNVAPFNYTDAYTKAQIDAKYNDYTRWTKTLSASATTISGTDNNSTTLSYTPGKEQVYINGSLIMRGTEYTASSGSTVVLNEAAVVDDVIDIVSITPFNIANVYTQTQVDSKVGTNGGMVLINSTSFTAASSTSINNCFSSTYNNYLILVESNASSGGYMSFRLRLSGTDASGSNYSWGFLMTSNLGTAFQLAGTGATSANILRPSTSGRSISTFTIYNPALAQETVWSGTTSYNDGATVGLAGSLGGIHAVSTAYDGFTLSHGGTITGTVRVYGYRNDV